jgi:hypothetical protein
MLSLGAIMKPILCYIFLFGLFFTQPCHGLLLESKQNRHLTNANLKATSQDNFFDVDDSQNSDFYFDDDDLNDDDDITSIKKKTFVFVACFDRKQNTLIYFGNNFKTKFYCYKHFSHFPLSDFISLRMLKL